MPVDAGGATADGAQEPLDDASGGDSAAAEASLVSDSGGACVSQAGGRCGGFTQDPCSCAPGLMCQLNRISDVPGVCVRAADAACVDNVLCIQGDHWNSVLCKCVPSADAGSPRDASCVDNVLCIVGSHWDPIQCRCAPTAPEGGACSVAADCHGVLPQLCVATCGDGGPGACAHFVCKSGACETVVCE